MKKEFIKIGSALVILFGLILTIWWHRKGQEVKQQSEEKEQKVVKADLDRVNRYVITNSEGKIQLDRRKPPYEDALSKLNDEYDKAISWRISDPYQDLADSYSVDTLKTRLSELKTKKEINEKGENAADYGLINPPLKIELYEGESNQPTFTLRIGDDNSASSGAYIQTSASPAIYLIDIGFNFFKTKKLSEWRRKEIVGFPNMSKVKKLRVETEKTPTILLANEDGKWMLQEPRKLLADKNVTNEFINTLKNMRATSVVSESADKDSKKFGFEKPYGKYTVTHETATGAKEKKIILGNKMDKDKDIYIRRGDFHPVYAVAPSNKNSLTKNVDDFIFKTPLEASKDDVTGIVVMQGDRRIELVKKDDKWSLIAPTAATPEITYVNALVMKLIQWKGVKYLGTSLSSEVKKSKPIYEITVTAGKEKKSLTLFAKNAKSDPEGKSDETKMVWRFKREDVETLDGILKDLLSPPEKEDK